MRKGILWAVALWLGGGGLAVAQTASAPGSRAMLGAPEMHTEDAAPPDTSSIWTAARPQPLGFWVNADYLLWWMKGGPVNTPLVTTGSLAEAVPGALGQPGTQVLFGDHAMNYGALSGVRLGGGIELAPGLALEGNYFLLQHGAVHFGAASNAAGSPLIARPFFNNQLGVEDSLGTSDPGVWAGSTLVTSYTQLQGWELNLASTHVINGNWSFVALGGFRSLNLNEDLAIQDHLTPLAAGILNFQSLPADPPSTLSDLDRFHTSNTFYGGQIGGRLEWANDRFSVGLLGKVAFGVNQQLAIIDGSSTLTTPAGSTTVPGGVLALATNSGRYYRSVFSVVPEGGLNLGWNITPRLKATIGYTFLYWTDVARPGNQIDRNLNPALQPTNQTFGNGLGAAQPTFSFHETGFWAQGVNVGLEIKF